MLWRITAGTCHPVVIFVTPPYNYDSTAVLPPYDRATTILPQCARLPNTSNISMLHYDNSSRYLFLSDSMQLLTGVHFNSWKIKTLTSSLAMNNTIMSRPVGLLRWVLYFEYTEHEWTLKQTVTNTVQLTQLKQQKLVATHVIAYESIAMWNVTMNVENEFIHIAHWDCLYRFNTITNCCTCCDLLPIIQ